MAINKPIKTTTNTTSDPSSQLPPPHIFDVLPALHELLARIDAYNTQQQTLSLSLDALETDSNSNESSSSYASVQPLNPKDLPTAALDIKARIRAALREVEKLPDVDRSVEEQEEEIEELEDRIRRQKMMLRGLGEAVRGLENRVRES